MKGVNTMFTMTRSVPVNDRGDPDIPVLNRDQVWKGLELKAENALPFVPKMTKCDTIERGHNYLVRDIVFSGELSLRFTFSLEKEGIPPDSSEEQAYARQMEGDYLGAVQATLSAIRKWVKEGTLESQSAV